MSFKEKKVFDKFFVSYSISYDFFYNNNNNNNNGNNNIIITIIIIIIISNINITILLKGSFYRNKHIWEKLI